jgi:hypothetical protein
LFSWLTIFPPLLCAKSWPVKSGSLFNKFFLLIIILLNKGKIFRILLFRLALRTEAEEVQAMAENSKTGFLTGHLDQMLQAAQLRVHDFFALKTDDMGVGVRFAPIIAVHSFGETQFQNLV